MGLTCPEGIIALIEDCQKTSFLSLHPLRVPWEVGAYRQEEGLHLGTELASP